MRDLFGQKHSISADETEKSISFSPLAARMRPINLQD